MAEYVGNAASWASQYKDNMLHNIYDSFARVSPQKWIRLVIIVGAYLLLRPYLLRLGQRQQMKQHERDEAQARADADAAANNKILPNELRGGKTKKTVAAGPGAGAGAGGGVEGEGEQGGAGGGDAASAASATEWGKKARKRQRQVIKKILDAEERRLQELQDDEDDKDIEEFLT